MLNDDIFVKLNDPCLPVQRVSGSGSNSFDVLLAVQHKARRATGLLALRHNGFVGAPTRISSHGSLGGAMGEQAVVDGLASIIGHANDTIYNCFLRQHWTNVTSTKSCGGNVS